MVEKRSAVVWKPLREAEQNMFDSFNVYFNVSLPIFQCQGTLVFPAFCSFVTVYAQFHPTSGRFVAEEPLNFRRSGYAQQARRLRRLGLLENMASINPMFPCLIIRFPWIPIDSHQNHSDKMGYKMGYSYTQISWIPVDGRGRSTGRSYASQRGRDPNVPVETAGRTV